MKAFKLQYIKDKNESGVATLLMVTILVIVFMMVSVAMAKTNLIKFKSLEDMKNTRSAYYLAESGIEDSLYLLFDNISYSGNPDGEVTEIGTYYTTVDKLGDIYTITAWAVEGGTKRINSLNVNISYELAEVTTKATYMADFFWISGEGSRIRGDVWTNDDFEVLEHGVVEGNLVAAGKGSFAVNWVWDGVIGGNPELTGGEILDNPETPEFDGNLTAADDVKVSGPTAYVAGNVVSDGDVYEIFGGTIDGEIIEDAGIDWELIPVPQFDFDEYKQEAITKGTYFNNSNSFENYLDSLDDGEERRLPEDLYYINNGAVRIYAGTPVYIDGLIVVEDNMYIYSEWYQNAIDGLPAIVCGKTLEIGNKFNFWSWSYDYAGPVRINGIIFAEKRMELFRTFSNEDIIIEGATWAGDDIFVMEHTYIHYNIDPMAIQGFNFVNGISDIQKNYWQEVI